MEEDGGGSGDEEEAEGEPGNPIPDTCLYPLDGPVLGNINQLAREEAVAKGDAPPLLSSAPTAPRLAHSASQPSPSTSKVHRIRHWLFHGALYQALPTVGFHCGG